MNEAMDGVSAEALAFGNPDCMEALAHCAPLCANVADAGSLHLVRSKLKPPLQAAACVPRPGLLARLHTALQGRLLLLVAPVGSGKTTLLTQWHAEVAASQAVAWVSLDVEDDDPVRFFVYLVEAVRSVVPGFNPCMPGCHEAEQRFPLLQVVSVLGEALLRVMQPLVIVLDDFQWITAPALVKALDFLVNRSSPNIHWIISTRVTPELNTGPLRLNDQFTTLDGVDLNFCHTQIVQLGQELCGRPLLAAEADCIQSRTEGWVAGVKMALLSAAGPRARAGALQQFNGSQGEVAQYFGASLLRELSPELRDFLVASSVVDRMTGDLCNALLGISHGQHLLEQLEQLQLFIQPVDSQGRWYRYHTLFQDFLRAVLRRDGARLDALHERASRWFAEHQLHEEALHHAFSCGNAPWRSELVARCVPVWRQGGEVAEVIRWCEKLPRAEVIGHLDIGAAYIIALLLSRRFDEAAAALDDVQAWTPGDQTARVARMRMLRMMLALLSDSGEVCPLADSDTLHRQVADRYLSGVLLTLQAYDLLRQHAFDAAWRLAMRASDQLQPVSLHGFGYASAVVALAERARGDLKAATQRCKQAYALVKGGRRNPAWLNAASAMAHLRYEENRMAEAEALYAEILPMLSAVATVEAFSTAYLTLARIKASTQHVGEAFQLLDYLHSVLESGRHRRFLAQLGAEKIRLHLAQGHLEGARKVAGEFGLPQMAAHQAWQVARPYDEAWERLGGAHAGLLMHQQAPQAAAEILGVLRESARMAGFVYREMCLEAALSACHWVAGDCEAAFRALNRGLAHTQGLGFSRGVFDEQPVLTQVIGTAFGQHKLHQPLSAEYLGRFDMLRDRAAYEGGASARKLVLPLEPLTDREIEVLRLLARGLSNQEISAQSRIALSTAKWHLQNVFAKLDVSTRMGAVARARALQLIE